MVLVIGCITRWVRQAEGEMLHGMRRGNCAFRSFRSAKSSDLDVELRIVSPEFLARSAFSREPVFEDKESTSLKYEALDQGVFACVYNVCVEPFPKEEA